MTSGAGKREEDRVGLRTRHVFLDTEVYRAHGHDVSSAPFRILAGLIEEHRVTLHVADITLEEAARHISEQAAEIGRSASELRRKSEQWNRRFPRATMPEIPGLDTNTVEKLAASAFRWTVRYEWNAENHEALNCAARPIFERYFARKPPFDQGKKEFPDAFVIQTLAE